MTEQTLILIVLTLFLASFALCLWLIGRVMKVKRDYVDQISALTKVISLVSDMDGRVTKIRARSKENELDILRIERSFKRLSTTMASQAARDHAAQADLAMTNFADYIQDPQPAENQLPAPIPPAEELGFRG